MRKLLISIALFILIAGNSYAVFTYSDLTDFKELPIVGVAPENEQGVIGKLRIYLIKNGSGIVYFDSNYDIDFATRASIINTVKAAETYYGVQDSEYDYFVQFDIPAYKISGESSNAAVFILVAALHNKKYLKEDILITGYPDENLDLKGAGGILKKIQAANLNNFEYMLIPETKLRLYFKRAQTTSFSDNFSPHENYFIIKEIGFGEYFKDKLNVDLIEINNMQEALDYFFEWNEPVNSD
ncbi:hypothetical protein JW949_01985 [Candidatus Woesearchaeota archaeon]|nr:hypothetical protein [Candidatus Woesearchaeota archaeon]